jgi:hypothetical protein
MTRIVFALALMFTACDDSGTGGTTGGGPDLSMVVKNDLSMNLGPLSCSAVLDCYNNCMDQQCIDDCYARDTAKAKMLDDDLFYGCPVRTCAKPTDAGAGACTQAEVTAIEADFNATVSMACSDCMSNVDIATDCKTEIAACMADK